MNNIFAELPNHSQDELVDLLAGNEHVRVERIVSNGQTSPEGFWYDQEENEWVIVLRGKAKMLFADGASVHMKPGDHILIPAHRKHRVEWTEPHEPTVWLAVFYPSAENQV